MEITIPVSNTAYFDQLLKSIGRELTASRSERMELVAVKSEAGGFIMERLPVNAKDIYRITKE